MISRSQCLYRIFFLGDIPTAEHRAAVNLKISRWSPFDNTGRYVVMEKDRALVWIWDDGERAARGEAVGEEKLSVVPEPLLVPPPDGDGLRLLTCMEGVEVQVWRDGLLQVGRWFKELPGPVVLQRFLASNDLDPDTPVPEPPKEPWLAKPWAKSSDHTLLTTLKSESLLIHAFVAMLILGIAWNTVTFFRYHRSSMALEGRIEVLEAEIEPILTARGAALEEQLKVEKIRGLLSGPSQLRLMVVVAGALPLKKVSLTEWHYTPSTVTIVLEGEEHNPLLYVKKLQALPLFSNVKASQGKNRKLLEITMEMVEEPQE